jgi:hypothetical protein
MKRTLAFVLALPLFALPATAKIKGCYFVRYDAGVLQRHPKQLVTKMAFQIGAPGNTDDDEDILTLLVRNSKSIRLNGFKCLGSSAKLSCVILDSNHDNKEGGAFTIVETPNGVAFTAEDDLPMVGEGGAENFIVAKTSKVEDRTFNLKKLKEANCPYIYEK